MSLFAVLDPGSHHRFLPILLFHLWLLLILLTGRLTVAGDVPPEKEPAVP